MLVSADARAVCELDDRITADLTRRAGRSRAIAWEQSGLEAGLLAVVPLVPSSDRVPVSSVLAAGMTDATCGAHRIRGRA